MKFPGKGKETSKEAPSKYAMRSEGCGNED